MQIDDPIYAKDLMKRLEAQLPMRVYPTPKLLKNLKAQGKSINPNQECIVESVLYTGDEGGILCQLRPGPANKEMIITSLTHLKVDPKHPMVDELRAYQTERTRRLELSHRGGFAAEVLGDRTAQSKRSKKGFGK